ncbi:uncharacterized protein LOC105211272 [Zeugodacus cucurbitae]|uniref:uncharacterized protein LOC105211272 n=1 Tax=Zeugodacus cucurbitae TaxID=28588 RepID=UPI000596A6E5|nr:uncharacterized protein LOC105211272 [Zeugodacus cucurbitae]
MQCRAILSLIWLLAFGFYRSAAAELSVLISNMQQGIGATSCIYYNYNAETNIDLSEIWQQCSAQIVLTKQPNIPLYEHFHSKALNIVFVNSKPIEVQFENFKYATQRWHSGDVLFIAAKIGNNATTATPQALFNWCWRNGYTNVLLTDVRANELLTYVPFPAVRLRNTTLCAYLRRRNVTWRNFHGYNIRAVSGTQPPRAIIYTDAGGVQQISGLQPLIIKLFAARYNATLNFTIDPNPNYDFLQCIPELLDGRYDICADHGYYRGYYNKPHSKPLYLDFAYFAVRFPQPLAKFRYFLAPFQASTWCLFVITIAYITLLLAMSNWLERGHWNAGQYLLAVISSFINASMDDKLIKSRRGVYIFVLLTVAGFIISNFYLAFLFSLLSTILYEQPINSVADIVAANVTVLTIGSYEILLRRLPEYDAMQVQYLTIGALKLHRDRLDPSYAYANMLDIWQFLFYQQRFLLRPRLKLLDQPLITYISGMPLARDWPFEQIFNRHVQQLFEYGFHKYFMQRITEIAINTGFLKFFQTEYHKVVPLNLSDFGMPALLLGGGYLIAFVVFLVELAWQWLRRRTSNRGRA